MIADFYRLSTRGILINLSWITCSYLNTLAVINLTVFDIPVSQIPSAPNQNSQNLATCLSVHLMRYPSAYNVVEEIPFSNAEEEK